MFMKKIALFTTVACSLSFAANAKASPNIDQQSQSAIESLKLSASPFEVCQDVPLISNADYLKNKDFWDQARVECEDLDVQILPDTGFFNTMIGKLGEQDDAVRSREFLKRVGDRTAKYMQTNNEITEHLIHCAKKDKAWFDTQLAKSTSPEQREFYDFGNCASVMEKAKNEIGDAASKARILVGFLASQRSQLPGWRAIADKLRGASGLKLAIENQEPTEAEKVEIRKLTEKHWKDRDAKVQEWNNDPKFVKGNLSFAEQGYKTKKFLETWDELLAIVQQVPVLAYLDSNVATDQSVAAASEKVLKNGIDSRNEVLKLLAAGEKTERTVGRGAKAKVSDQERMKAMFELMKYGPVAKEILKEDPQMCQTATGIANHISNTELRNNAALMVGMLGTAGAAAVVGPAALAGTAIAAVATPAFMATGAGIGFSAYLGVKDYQRYADSKRRTFSVVETGGVLTNGQDKGRAVSDVKEFDQYRDSFMMALALSPADLVGSGVYMGVAGHTIGKFLQGPGARKALTGALRSKGIGQVEVDRLFKDLVSEDAKVAQTAARKIITEVGMDENMIKFVRMAAAKRAYAEQNPEAMASILKEVKDGKTYMGAMKVLENVNSAKINPANRDQVLRAAIAGAEFGVTDPKKLAAVITDWDQGLDGLSRTYKVAADKMKTVPEISKIANVEEKQRMAFRAALNDLRAENPELRAMPETEWKKMADEMEVCPLRAAK
jgi:hypothetical protein